MLDAVNGVKRLGGLTTLSEYRPMVEVATGMGELSGSVEISTEAAPLAQATGDLQEQNRQQIDIDDMRRAPLATAATRDAGAEAEPATATPAAVPPTDAALPDPQNQTNDPAGADAAPLTLNQQLQAASQARMAERDALAKLLAG